MTAGEQEAAAPDPERNLVIVMDEVTRRFNGVTAVQDLTLSIERGRILGLIGPSGSGKTTTVRMVAGALAASAGTIRVLGENPLRFSRALRQQIAYLPQIFSLYGDLTVGENTGFIAALYGISAFSRAPRIRRALEVVDLWDKRDRLARHLSGGEQQRLELACAIVHEPMVLFVDEPTAGVDPILRQEIWNELRLMRDDGRTLMVTTQYVAEAEYCDEVALLHHGRLVARDTPDALRRSVAGGDVLEIETDREVDPNVLAHLPDVRNVRQAGPRRLVVLVGAAPTATPRLFEALAAQQVGVSSLSQHQPTFDEIFGDLVEQRRNGDDGGDGRSEPEPSAKDG